MKKTCSRCGYDGTEFYKNRSRPDGLDEYCKSCRNAVGRPHRKKYEKEHRAQVNAQSHKYYMQNREHLLAKSLARYHAGRLEKHGLSDDEFTALLDAQDGMCAICGGTGRKRLAIDHDHDTGDVRGLLCSQCNLGLGNFKDSPKVLRKAIKYLKASGS